MTFYEVISQITMRNVIDVLLVAIFFYQIISMMRGTRAAQVVIGLLVLFIAYAASSLLEFDTLYWIISKFYASFIIVVIVLFQDDIRRLLTSFGRGPFVTGLEEGSGLAVIEEIISAAKNLSHERLGAILVFERGVGLERLYDHAVQLDALVSEQLLLSIFQSFSPLHDGAVIIQKNRISCASAHLPLSKTSATNHGKKMGTRHSAAVGISEQTDAVVLVVSEETGAISIALNGEIQRQHSPEAAKKKLCQLLLPPSSDMRLGSFLGHKYVYWINKKWLKFRSQFPSTYNNAERRTNNLDRRHRYNMRWNGNIDTLQAVERENHLAATELHMNLRFPGLTAQEKIFKSTRAGGLLFTSSIKNKHEETPHSEKTLEVNTPALQNNSHNNYSDDTLPAEPEEALLFEQNEAAMSLNTMTSEDKFVPPEIHNPPPRDVSIGGVSLNPPMETSNIIQPKSSKPESKT